MSTEALVSNPSRVISVGGGKGGVGKSIVAANLAVSLAQAGRRVVLVDLDLGAANQHLLLGIASGRPGIRALIDGTAADVKDALTPTDIPNLSLLAGTGAVLGAANITYNSKQRILRKLRALDSTVVLDVGAGVGYNALDFFLLGGQKLVVTTPQVTAIHDAYSFLKGAVLRLLQQHADRHSEAALLEPALMSGETAKVAGILEKVREQKPELAEKITTLLRTFGAYIVGNQVTSPAEAGIFTSVSRMMRDFLGIDVPVVGWLQNGPAVSQSVNERRPFMLGRPTEPARVLRKIADVLMAEELSVDIELDITEDSEVESRAPAAAVVAAEVASPARAVDPATPKAPAKESASGPTRIAPDIRPVPMGLPIIRLPRPSAVSPGRRRPVTLPGMIQHERARR